MKSFSLPAYNDHSPLASAVHGLGLLLVTGMALGGAIYYAATFVGAQQTPLVRLVIEIHALFGNVVWAYLIGHASLALIHHYKQNLPLTAMWSLRRR